jgi:hypothetical protein
MYTHGIVVDLRRALAPVGHVGSSNVQRSTGFVQVLGQEPFVVSVVDLVITTGTEQFLLTIGFITVFAF